jgi:hypothetical protein
MGEATTNDIIEFLNTDIKRLYSFMRRHDCTRITDQEFAEQAIRDAAMITDHASRIVDALTTTMPIQ